MRPARRAADIACWCASSGSSSRNSDAATRCRATQSAFSLLSVLSSPRAPLSRSRASIRSGISGSSWRGRTARFGAPASRGVRRGAGRDRWVVRCVVAAALSGAIGRSRHGRFAPRAGVRTLLATARVRTLLVTVTVRTLLAPPIRTLLATTRVRTLLATTRVRTLLADHPNTDASRHHPSTDASRHHPNTDASRHRPEYGRFSPPPEYGRFSPPPEYGRFSPPPEYGRFSPPPEYGRFSPPPEYGRFSPPPEYGRFSSPTHPSTDASRHAIAEYGGRFASRSPYGRF